VVVVVVVVLAQRWEWARFVGADRWRRRISLEETRLRTGDDKDKFECGHDS